MYPVLLRDEAPEEEKGQDEDDRTEDPEEENAQDDDDSILRDEAPEEEKKVKMKTIVQKILRKKTLKMMIL